MKPKSISRLSALALLCFACNEGGQQSGTQPISLNELNKSVELSRLAKDSMKQDRDHSTEDYDYIVENSFISPRQEPLSTFSIDVDEAAYSNVRRYLEEGSLPPAGAVRIEEMINYFDYVYDQPTGDEPFSVTTEIGECPWNTSHNLV